MLNQGQIAVSNYHYRYHPFALFVENQKKLGFSAVEIWGGAPHFCLDDETAEGFREARQLLDEAGLRVEAFTPESVTCLYGLCAWNDEVRQKARNYYRLAIDGAKTLGASIVTLHCTGGALDEPPQRAFYRAVSALRDLGGYAAERGVTLAVETNCPEEGNIVRTLPELKRLLDTVDLPNVKAGFDLCSASMAGETMEEWFQTFRERIAYVHFSDGKPAGRMVWGHGNHPLEDMLQELGNLDWRGPLGLVFTKESYFFDPKTADQENFRAWQNCMEQGREQK